MIIQSYRYIHRERDMGIAIYTSEKNISILKDLSQGHWAVSIGYIVMEKAELRFGVIFPLISITFIIIVPHSIYSV
jgi:hypothetical protein